MNPVCRSAAHLAALTLCLGCGSANGGDGDPPPVATVTVAPPSASIVVGATTQLTATLRDAQGNVLTGRSVTWSSDNGGIASVSTSGLVQGEANGMTTVRATSEGRSGSSQITVTTTPPPVASVVVAPATASVTVNGTTQLTATAYDGQGNALPGRPITWMSDNAGIASVNTSGLVRGEAVGMTTVRATSEGQSGSSQITVTGGSGSNFAMRFYANNSNDLGRVKIALDMPHRPVDVGATDFTIEFWVRASTADNTQPSTTCGQFRDAWIEGNILLDRDRFTADRDYGLAFLAGRVAFGVRTTEAWTICGSTNVLDNQWHHIAVTRSVSTGALALYVDGALDASATGPAGDISYPDGVTSSSPNDPFLVIGAEKHNIPSVPGFNGHIDELRFSTIRRYTAPFIRPSSRFTVDANTAALYHFDEGSGTVLVDAVGSSNGDVRVGGGPPTGPVWVPSTAPTD